MAEITLPNNWKPRPYQQGLWNYLELGGKRAYMVAHRRWGKDDVALHMTATKMMEEPGNYWHMLPEGAQARKAIWDAVNPHTGKKRIDEAFPKALRSRTNDSEMKIELINGSMWQALGSDNYNNYMGAAPRGILFSEWALADPQAWPYMQPILEENNGWAVFITTPRGRNHASTFFDMAQTNEGWYCEKQTAAKTGVFTQKQLDSIQSELIQLFGHAEGKARFMQEYFCSFDAALPGAYYGEQINAAEAEERITFVPWDPNYRVVVSFDFGRGQSNAAALVFTQVIGLEPRIIDYHEDNTGDIPTHCELMRKKPYAYSHLVLPHDAKPVRYGTGLSYEDQFKAAGFKVKVMKVTPDLKRDINITRQFIKIVWINVRKCTRLIECLRAYHREWNTKDKVFEDHPKHDWCLTGDTKVFTRDGLHRIMDMPKQGEVLTSCGWKRYTSPRITRRNAPLVEVTFIDGLTVRCTPEHLFKTAKGWKSAGRLAKGSMILSSLTPPRSTSMESCTDYSPPQTDTFHAVAAGCIEWFGKMRSVIFPRTAISIIKMMIAPIIYSRILNAFLQKNIYLFHGSITELKENNTSPKVPVLKRQNGIDQRPVCSGISATPSVQSHGQNGRQPRSIVYFVKTIFKDLSARMATGRSIARPTANQHTIEIAAVKRLDYLSDVWCLTVPGYEEFSLSNGAIVHNSSHGADGVRAAAVAHKMGLLVEDTDIEQQDDMDDGGDGTGVDNRNSISGY